MNVSFEIFPSEYHFFSRNKENEADIRLKGSIEADDGIERVAVVKAMSMTSGIIISGRVISELENIFDITLKVPVGSNYRIVFEIVRKHNEEWIDYIKSFNHISVGDVFVIAGQSNAVGYGRGSFENIPDLRISNFRMCGKWAVATHPLNALTDYDRKISRDQGEYSPHITMAKKIIEHTGVPIAFIPTAVGGTPISRWNKRYKGDLYYDMIKRIKESGADISGVIWYQGESDAIDNEASHKYADSFNEFISDTREALCSPYLKFFVYQINRRIAEKEERSENWSVVRDALRRAGHGSNVYTVPAFGAELMEDGLHNSPSGCDLIGSRMAGVILSALYNKRVSSNIPDEQKTEKTGEKEITVYFNDETYFASKSSTGGEFDFKVTDYEGEIENCEIILNVNKVIIKTVRPIRGKATVYGAYGANPKKNIPYDCISKNPMLGFIAKV